MSTKKALFPCHVLNILKFILLGIVIEERLETLIFGFSMEKKGKSFEYISERRSVWNEDVRTKVSSD